MPHPRYPLASIILGALADVVGVVAIIWLFWLAFPGAAVAIAAVVTGGMSIRGQGRWKSVVGIALGLAALAAYLGVLVWLNVLLAGTGGKVVRHVP